MSKGLKSVKEYSVITLGTIMYVLAWTVFLAPNNLVGGGLSGVSSIIQYATKGVIRMGYSYFVMNIFLLAIALFTLGKGFGAKTVYAIILSSIGLNVFQDLIPYEVINALSLKNGQLMSVIMGAILVGCSVGMTMAEGGSTGGTDIIALIVNKKHNISPGRMLLSIDLFIITSSLLFPSYTPEGSLVPFTDKIVKVVYGFIMITIENTVLDMYLNGTRQSSQVMVFSKKYADIADSVTKELNRGVTVLDGMGWYSKQESKVLVIVTRKTEVNFLMKYIKAIDPQAFVSVASVNGVYGEGFDEIKGKAASKKKS